MERLFNFKSATEVVNSKTNVGGSKTPTSLLGGHNLTAQSEDVNFYRNGSIDEHDDPYDNTMKLPIKNHIAKLEEQALEIKNDFESTVKDLQIIRGTVVGFEHFNRTTASELTNYVLEELKRIEKEFKKNAEIEKEETNFLKQQIAQLNQDKIKLQQHSLILENRVLEVENEVGFQDTPGYHK